MLICDAEYVHIWRFGGDGADAAFPAHELRVKSQGARCIALTGAHHHDAAQAAWGCADGRVNFYDAAAQTHALYIPAQPLRTPPGAKGGASPICAMCFVFSRLVLCGDESGELFLVEFGLEGPQVLQAIEVHNKRITSIDSGKQGTVVVSDESGAVSVWTTLPSPPYLQLVDFVEFSHLFPSASSPHACLSTLARVLPTATSSLTTNGFLSHPTSIFVAAKLQLQVITCTYDYHTKRVTCMFPNLVLEEYLRTSPLSDAAILQIHESDSESPGLVLQPVLAIGGELLTPHSPTSTLPSPPSPSLSRFTLNGFAGLPKGVRFAGDGDVVAAFTENQVILWKTPQ